MNSDSTYEVEFTLFGRYRSDEKGKRIYKDAAGDSLVFDKAELRDLFNTPSGLHRCRNFY